MLATYQAPAMWSDRLPSDCWRSRFPQQDRSVLPLLGFVIGAGLSAALWAIGGVLLWTLLG